MRIIARGTLRSFWKKHPKSESQLKAWFHEVKTEKWKNPNEVKQKYRSASLLGSKRIVFNISGNDFRLIVDVEYSLKIVFVVWLGTHKEYDSIDAKKITYVKNN